MISDNEIFASAVVLGVCAFMAIALLVLEPHLFGDLLTWCRDLFAEEAEPSTVAAERDAFAKAQAEQHARLVQRERVS